MEKLVRGVFETGPTWPPRRRRAISVQRERTRTRGSLPPGDPVLSSRKRSVSKHSTSPNFAKVVLPPQTVETEDVAVLRTVKSGACFSLFFFRYQRRRCPRKTKKTPSELAAVPSGDEDGPPSPSLSSDPRLVDPLENETDFSGTPAYGPTERTSPIAAKMFVDSSQIVSVTSQLAVNKGERTSVPFPSGFQLVVTFFPLRDRDSAPAFLFLRRLRRFVLGRNNRLVRCLGSRRIYSKSLTQRALTNSVYRTIRWLWV